MKKILLQEYLTIDGKNPFRQWLEGLGTVTKARIQARVSRFEESNFGDHKSVGRGVWESRVHFGAGYRIYFGKDGEHIIILLSGGDKDSQSKDIKQAQYYWDDYKRRKSL